MNNFVSLQVPELAGSWLLTLLLSTPLILLLNINDNAILLPLERALHLIMGLFVLFEVIIGYFAIRAMVNYQVSSIGPSSKFLLNLMIALIIKIFAEVFYYEGKKNTNISLIFENFLSDSKIDYNCTVTERKVKCFR